MSTRDAIKIANNESTKGKKAHPYVIDEGEIRAYVESVAIRDLRAVAVRFQVVADLTCNAFEQSKDNLAPSELRRIKRIVEEDNTERYRRIMRAIISGIGQGRHGINSAHLTATVAVSVAFRWSREYFSALNTYRDDLRRGTSTLHERHSSRRTRRRSILDVGKRSVTT